MKNISDKIANDRLYSLDALRGFDMLWIIGLPPIINSLAKLFHYDWGGGFARQMEHVPWEGFHFYDLIFPLFMFIAGVAIPFSIKSKLKKGIPKKELILKACKRMLILIVLGILYNGTFRDGFANARYASILGQIGIAYFFCFLIVLYSKSVLTYIYWLTGILAGISILQLFVPVPGIGAGILTPEGCINGYIDRMLLPGRLAYGHNGMLPSNSMNGIYDALGYLSTISAIGITLLGAISGHILKETKTGEYRKVLILSTIGISLIIISWPLSHYYPIIKNCWTSTYNFRAGGISLILMALFYLIIDVWKIRRWAFPLRIIGMNSIFIYLIRVIIPISIVVEFFIGWTNLPNGNTKELLHSIGYLSAEWLLLYFMYKRKIFMKV